MGVGFLTKSDLYALHNYVQHTGHAYVKEFIIDSLREFFSQDSYYRYVRDAWGFPLTPSQEDLASDAGINDSTTTRLFIGEYTRQHAQFFPAILVRSGGYRSTPISMSRNKYSVQYDPIKYFDGYGNETIINTPVSVVHNGAWDGTITMDIVARSNRARSELADLCMIFFTDYHFEDFYKAGIVIKSSQLSADSEADDRNDKLYKTTVTLEVRSEWERSTPIQSTLDAITICMDIGNINQKNTIYAPNITIETSLELNESLLNL
jgi:hypothetical protein